MKRFLLTLFFSWLVVSTAHAWDVQAVRKPGIGTWPELSVPSPTGALTDVVAVYGIDNTGATNVRDTLKAAFNASGGRIYLQPGTYRFDNFFDLQNFTLNANYSDCIIRGAGNSTILDCRSSIGISMGGDISMGNPANATTSGLTLAKGATSVTVATETITDFVDGKMLRFSFVDPDPLLITETKGRATFTFFTMVTAKVGNVLTFSPAIPYDMVNATVVQSQFASAKRVVLEDFKITGANSSGNVARCIDISGVDSCWIHNVTAEGFRNYGIAMEQCTRSGVLSNYVTGPSIIDTNRGNILYNQSYGGWVVDNVSINGFPCIEENIDNTGNVIAYNFCRWTPNSDTIGIIYGNHTPYCQYNLYEGNDVDLLDVDNYHGFGRRDTYFRNKAIYVEAHRGAREFTMASNYMSDRLRLGLPNLGNLNNTGFSSFYQSRGSLTTRTSATAGVFTATTGQDLTVGNTITVTWSEIYPQGIYNVSYEYARRNVNVTAVSGNDVTFSGGTGDTLPPTTTLMWVPTSTEAYRDYPLPDWDPVAHRPRYWNASVATKTDNTHGVITVDSGTASTFAQLLVSTGNLFSIVSPNFGFVYSPSVSGFDYTITLLDSSQILADPPTALILTPGQLGFQQLDMDNIATLDEVGNIIAGATPNPLPGGDTFPNSLFATSKPAWWGNLAWPYTGGMSPARYRFENGDSRAYLTAGPNATAVRATATRLILP